MYFTFRASCEQDHAVGEVLGLADEPARRFHQPLQQQHTRQDRERGEMVAQVLLGQRYALDRREGPAFFQRHDLVYQYELHESLGPSNTNRRHFSDCQPFCQCFFVFCTDRRPGSRVNAIENGGESSILGSMKVRSARISDAKVICSLINYYAEHDKMLFRSLAEIYENLQTFLVAEGTERPSAAVPWRSSGRTWPRSSPWRSRPQERGKGVGTALVTAALEQARHLGVPRVFALTLEPKFFERVGFTIVKKEELPMKVWSDCARCPKQDECDEIAVIRDVPSGV